MALKTFEIEFKDLAKELSFRFDVDFIEFNINAHNDIYRFQDLFLIESFEKKERLELLDNVANNDFYYSEISNVSKLGDVEPVKLNFNERNELLENYFKKIEKGDIQNASIGNILLAKVRPNLKKYVLIDNEYNNYFYTTAFINLNPKK
jgi:hypothetical protein